MSGTTATLGLPRIGARRELTFALETYWSGRTDAAELQETAAALRAQAPKRQRAPTADWLPSSDFSFYDHVDPYGGLMTRRREEGRPAIEAMVAAARTARAEQMAGA